MTTLLSAVKWIMKSFRGAFIHSKAVVLAFVSTVYTIWSYRNQVLLACRKVTTDEIGKVIKMLVFTVVHAIHPAEVYFF